MDDIYKNIEEQNPNNKHKILIVFDMIADMLSNNTPAPIVTELFIRERKLNISLGFILLCCIKKCKTKFYTLFFMKIPSK